MYIPNRDLLLINVLDGNVVVSEQIRSLEVRVSNSQMSSKLFTIWNLAVCGCAVSALHPSIVILI